MATQQPFRAIVVGGGPVGLTAAHALSQAGIDFILLENRDTCVPDFGASILIHPGNMRVFHQLGLYEKLAPLGTALKHVEVVTENGKKYKDSDPFDAVEESFGAHMLMLHRRDLLATLYDNLPPETRSEKIHVNKKVVDIQTTTSSRGPSHGGVSVTCADGTSYSGTIVIGADGVYSKTRLAMRNLALADDPQTTKINPERPFTSRYRCMWGTVPGQPKGTKPGSGLDCHTGKGYSIMTFIGEDRSWFFLYELLPPPSSSSSSSQPQQRPRYDYTPEDKASYAARYRHLPINESGSITFGDMWDTHITSGMSDLDEGICPQWSYSGRVVLAGDSAHKVTPNAGRGFNAGIQDVAVLVNRLRSLLLSLRSSSSSSSLSLLPTTSQLSTLFQSYQEDRMTDVKAQFSQSYAVTRQHARPPSWFSLEGNWYGFLETVTSWIGPGFDRFMIRKMMVPAVSKSFVLDWIHNGEPFKGTVGWVWPIKEKGA